MPLYVYQCPNCNEIVEAFRTVADRARRPDCPTGCGVKCDRALGLEGFGTTNADYAKPVLSERMGVMESQVPAHRKQFPNIPMTDTGEIIVRNGAEEKRINKELKKAFSDTG